VVPRGGLLQRSAGCHGIVGDAVDDEPFEKLLMGLAQAPLGLSRDDDFRLSVAGAQEKTALLWHDESGSPSKMRRRARKEPFPCQWKWL
jgi:hypothetical protein